VSIVGEKIVKSTRKAKGAGHLRRGEILTAAERIFVREGYHGATIRKIADEVGVSSTALYMHFRDKSEILVEICESVFAQLIAQTDEIATCTDLDPVDRVRRTLDGYISFGLEHPNAYQLVFASPPGALSADKLDAMQALGRQAYDGFIAVVREVAGQGRFRWADIDTVAQTLWAGAHGFVALQLTQRRFPWVEGADALKTTMLDTLFHGVLRD
jgi:AcrR family transcriptional regulator